VIPSEETLKKMHNLFKYLLLTLVSVNCCIGSNILFVSPVPSPSHHIWNRALAFGLVNKGHNVTLIGPDQDKVPKPANYTHILLEGIYDDLHDSFDMNEMASYSALRMMYEFEEWCLFSCKKLLKTNGLRRLLDYPPDFKFDLIIFDVTAGTCFYPLMHKLNYPPSVAVTAFLLPTYVANNFGNHLYPAYIPWYGLPYTTEMNFVQRVWNFVYMHFDIWLRYVKQYASEHDAAKEIFGENIPSMKELERHLSLVLTNTDPILDHPQAVAPNFIPVGGLHTRKSNNIPEDLQKLLDNAKNGVIVFSLGTNVRSDKLDKNIQKALLEAFSKISETVIWKFESELENLPKNVIVRKWLPQNDILGHPNVKLFIGHGGALSTQESIFHGVPMICIPFFVDQHINTKMIVKRKLGVSVDFKSITAGYMLRKLREILDDPTYRENMQKTASRFKDRTETPLERGIFWIEYVIRHGGANFLNTPARDYPFYVSSGLDVFVFLLLISIISISIFLKLIQLILKLFSTKTKVKVN
jgi:glucuronosyltransferase